VLNRALLRKVTNKNIVVGVERGISPERMDGFPPSLLANTHQIFSSADGGFEDVVQIATNALLSAKANTS
jgi:hypothetical protein